MLMETKTLVITIIGLVCVTVIIIIVMHFTMVVNRPSSDLSEFPLEEKDLQDTGVLADGQVSSSPSSQENRLETSRDRELEAETLENKSSGEEWTEEEWRQFEEFLSELDEQASEQEIIEEDLLQKWREEAKKELEPQVREALAEAKWLAPIVGDYQKQREKIASKDAKSQQLIRELEALNNEYQPYIDRLAVIHALVTDVEIIELIGDWVREEATKIFEPLGW